MSTITGQRIGFGIIYGFQPFDPGRLIAEAQHAESLGFGLFCVADHLHGAYPTPEPWTALSPTGEEWFCADCGIYPNMT